MNVQIINTTGIAQHTEVWVGKCKMSGIESILIDKLTCDSDLVRATIVCYVKELDIVANVDD